MPPKDKKLRSKGAPRKRTAMGHSLIAQWLYDEQWSVGAVSQFLGIARIRVKDVLNKPEQHLTIKQFMILNMMLPERSFADLINSITQAPIISNIYVEDGYLVTPRQKRKQWMDMDDTVQVEYDKDGNEIGKTE
jgi:hypothetical protein